MKIFSAFVIALFISTTSFRVTAQDVVRCDSTLDKSMLSSLDSLLGIWHSSGNSDLDLVPDSVAYDSTAINGLPADSIIIQRLSEIISPFPLPYNNLVRDRISFYVVRKRDQVERMAGLGEYYYPIFEAALDAKNLPLELKYLPIIESALNPIAKSKANAVGLWQFMYPTGKLYGLEVTSYVDERMDVIKSTNAAVNYLSDLYKIYGDWHMVIAAYNCGPGNVNKAIRRAGGGKKDYWQIYNYLPKETRSYVPAFIAAAYTMTYYREHNMFARPALILSSADTIMVDKLLHFDQVSQVLGISNQMLRELNPQYRNNVVPGSAKKPYALRLPFEQSLAFASLEDSIYRTDRTKYFANEKLVVNPSSSSSSAYVPGNTSAIYHTVRSGDTPGGIADRYRVSLTNLREWNHIRHNLIRVGQRLVVYVPSSKASAYGGSSKTTTSATPTSVTSDGEYIYYTVRGGDNLWTIARQFPGVTNTEIMTLNNMSSTKLSVGQKLKIKTKG